MKIFLGCLLENSGIISKKASELKKYPLYVFLIHQDLVFQPISSSYVGVDGGYNQWSMWSLCSATCGIGVKIRSRLCNSPPPRKGGKACSRLGKPYETVECDEGECPERT